MPSLRAALCLALTLTPALAHAETIRVTPADDYAAIERAQAGDEVIIAPGTYRFRVFLSQIGTADAPIVIRAEDPSDPPVWDLSGMRAEDAPGSSTRGDRGRGCWQITGAHYQISGLVIRGCSTSSGNAAGIRTIDTEGVIVRDVVFDGNEVGFSGTGEDTLVEHCELTDNGVRSSPPQHSIYIYGGSITFRHNYIHDSAGGQNLHIRARRAVVEYNWIARASNYEADLMTGPDADQELIFRGNVLLTNPSPENSGQVFVLYDDGGGGDVRMTLRLLWNTIIVQGGGDPALVNVRNDTLAAATVELSNNVVVGTTQLVRLRDEGASNWTVTGGSNHLPSGADEAGLTGNVLGDDPGFADAAALDYRPAPGSALLGLADLGVAGAPDREYAEDETVTRRFRFRLAAADVGALESGAPGDAFGPYDEPTPPTPGEDAGPADRDAGPRPPAPDASASPDGGPGGEPDPGCGCRVGAGSTHPGWLFALIPLLVLLGLTRVGSGPRRGGSRRSRRRQA